MSCVVSLSPLALYISCENYHKASVIDFHRTNSNLGLTFYVLSRAYSIALTRWLLCGVWVWGSWVHVCVPKKNSCDFGFGDCFLKRPKAIASLLAGVERETHTKLTSYLSNSCGRKLCY